LLVTACSAQPTVAPSPTEQPTLEPTASPSPSPTPTQVPTPTPTVPLPTPTPTATPIAPTADGVVSVPILYMHRVVEIPSDILSWTAAQRSAFLPYVITPCELSAKLDWLSANGYTTILPRDLTAYWYDKQALPGKPVILTFDDGWPDWMTTVLPMLKVHGFVAEFYIAVSHVGLAFSWADVRTLVESGMGIGAHDMDHFQLVGGGVPTASLDVMRYQVGQAKAELEAQLGITVDSMAYVGGGFDSTLIGVVRAAGYRSARAILRGIVQSPATRYDLHVSRIGLYDDVFNKKIADVMSCNLDLAMPDLQARLSGSDPG
jgi:peptidoglycan/xylan/chitin deacetylase (PgdA/CDA1 family)